MAIALTSVIILFGNLPFGYWRSNVGKYSFQWFLSIHLPVLMIVLYRIFGNFGFAWYTFVFSITSFVLGQLGGKLIHHYLQSGIAQQISSCLVMDLYRLCLHTRGK